MNKYLFSILLSLSTVACMPAYVAVEPGNINYDGLIIKTDQAWNLAPPASTPSARKGSKVWTQDGILLDRIMIIPAVPDSESLFVTTSKDQAQAPASFLLNHTLDQYSGRDFLQVYQKRIHISPGEH